MAKIVSANNSQSCLSKMKRKVKIYDVEKKELIKECDSLKEAAEFAGIKGGGGSVSNMIATKCRCYTNSFGKTICFR